MIGLTIGTGMSSLVVSSFPCLGQTCRVSFLPCPDLLLLTNACLQPQSCLSLLELPACQSSTSAYLDLTPAQNNKEKEIKQSIDLSSACGS